MDSAASRRDKPRSWMYGVPVGYLVAVCECAFELLDAAEAAPIPLSSATAMRWVDLRRALEALQDA